MYLTRDIIGAASGIVYGKKGDKVSIVNDLSEMILVELNGEKFHVKREDLTTLAKVEETKKDTEPDNPVIIKQNSKPAAPNKKKSPPPNQTKLF